MVEEQIEGAVWVALRDMMRVGGLSCVYRGECRLEDGSMVASFWSILSVPKWCSLPLNHRCLCCDVTQRSMKDV